MSNTFIDVDFWRVKKHDQWAEGDTFMSKRTGNRVLAVLSDGLGSGVKASVLSTLTATLAIRCMEQNLPIDRIAEMIMESLPVCSERRIAYATFTLVDVDTTGRVRMWEFDNPRAQWIRAGKELSPARRPVTFKGSDGEPKTLFRSEFHASDGDRIIFFSDGITQSGMGSRNFPLGWGSPKLLEFLKTTITQTPSISARLLARVTVKEALKWDGLKAKDDISCGVIYFRAPRELLLLTGPPYEEGRDTELANLFTRFKGKKIICGGTTAQLLARELGAKVSIQVTRGAEGLPPAAVMPGADLVTEGILTLGRIAERLAAHQTFENAPASPATDVILHFLDADKIKLVVGTRINEAHQDPHMPVELEIRRGVVKRIAALLQDKFLKEVEISFF